MDEEEKPFVLPPHHHKGLPQIMAANNANVHFLVLSSAAASIKAQVAPTFIQPTRSLSSVSRLFKSFFVMPRLTLACRPHANYSFCHIIDHFC